MMEVRGVEEGVESIAAVVFEGFFIEMVGSDGNING